MGKRFHTMISFNPDTGLKELLDKVMDYTLLMKDFQIKELLTADPLNRHNHHLPALDETL